MKNNHLHIDQPYTIKQQVCRLGAGIVVASQKERMEIAEISWNSMHYTQHEQSVWIAT